MIFNMQQGGVVPDQYMDAQTITPGTADQVIDAGTYLRGNLTIAGDEDLIPSKIPSDVNLFGVQGNRQPDYGLYVWERLSAKGGTFINYVVSDQADKYPNSGEQEGYWYEKLGVKTGSYTPTSNESYLKFEHGLGKEPRYYGVKLATFNERFMKTVSGEQLMVYADETYMHLYLWQGTASLGFTSSKPINWIAVG